MRHDWTIAEITETYQTPLLSLLFQAQQAAREFHSPDRVQTCRLISIKTGGCPRIAPTVRRARITTRRSAARD